MNKSDLILGIFTFPQLVIFSIVGGIFYAVVSGFFGWIFPSREEQIRRDAQYQIDVQNEIKRRAGK